VSEKAQITWLPYDLMDEMIPPPRNSPDDWIGSLDDGAPAIIADVDDGRTAEKICLLHDGDTVKFVDSPMPPEAEQVCAINGWQIESLANSVEECAAALLDYDAEPGDYELSYYTWSDGIPFVFDAAARTFRRQETAV
jgi:hypothetical protein